MMDPDTMDPDDVPIRPAKRTVVPVQRPVKLKIPEKRSMAGTQGLSIARQRIPSRTPGKASTGSRWWVWTLVGVSTAAVAATLAEA